jgi:hypothetical protein
MRIPADCIMVHGEAKVSQKALNGKDAEDLNVVSLKKAL